MSERPRALFASVVATVTVILMMAPAEPATAAPEGGCGILPGAVCSGAHGLVKGAKKIPGVGKLIDTAEGAYKTVDALSPSNFLDTWAQGLCHAVIFTLTFIESTAEELGKPAFDQKWWQAQYAVSFGLALVLLAFLLPVITARIGGPEGSVSGIELLRQSGWRLIFVVPACAFAPAFMYAVEQLAAALTKDFATSASVEANGAVGSLLTALETKAGDGWGDFGGTVMCIVLMLFILLAGVVLLIEVAVSNWGMMLCGLLVPLALVAAVYPPWSHVLKRVIGIICGMMFLPDVIFFFFWTIWSAFNANVNGQGGSNSTVTMMIYLLVALVMLDAFPLVAIWLIGVVAPGTEQMDPSVRGLAPQPTTGDVYESVFEKPLSGGTGGAGPQGEDGGTGGMGDDGDDADVAANSEEADHGAGDDLDPSSSPDDPGPDSSSAGTSSSGPEVDDATPSVDGGPDDDPSDGGSHGAGPGQIGPGGTGGLGVGPGGPSGGDGPGAAGGATASEAVVVV
ncbi:hypothetical protein [Streptomyces sp. CA2R106]|uniref:hypothetical protein n=1 Tax=Streptomyces sp. CA2R106 TaxID=3120153 RepID=UPI0030089A13